MQDDRADAGLNTTLDIGTIMFMILFTIFVPGLTTPSTKFITKLDVALFGLYA